MIAPLLSDPPNSNSEPNPDPFPLTAYQVPQVVLLREYGFRNVWSNRWFLVVLGALVLFRPLIKATWAELVLFLPFLGLALFTHTRAILRKHVQRLVVRDGMLKEYSSEGKLQCEINLGEVLEIRVSSKEENAFVTFTCRDGAQVKMGSSPSVNRHMRTFRDLVRAMSSHLPADVHISNFPIKETPALRHFIAQRFSPERVNMQPGVVYRYREGYPHLVEWSDAIRKNLPFGAAAMILFFGVGSALHYEGHVFLFMLVRFLQVGFLTFFLLRFTVFPEAKPTQSAKDRFRLLPEGLEVTRDGKSWTLADPQLATGRRDSLIVADQPVLRFRHGRTWYYFDPRFIEPDS